MSALPAGTPPSRGERNGSLFFQCRHLDFELTQMGEGIKQLYFEVVQLVDLFAGENESPSRSAWPTSLSGAGFAASTSESSFTDWSMHCASAVGKNSRPA
jgi:hypothetical protein